MKYTKIVCDRCGKTLPSYDERMVDFLQDQYPEGTDICPDCDLEIVLANALMTDDMVHNNKPGTALKKMWEMYNRKVEPE